MMGGGDRFFAYFNFLFTKKFNEKKLNMKNSRRRIKNLDKYRNASFLIFI
jgi:hypothetical protein